MTESVRRFLLRLRKNLPAAAASLLILFFYILIPLMEGRSGPARTPSSQAAHAEGGAAEEAASPAAGNAPGPADSIRLVSPVRTARASMAGPPAVAEAIRSIFSDDDAGDAPGKDRKRGPGIDEEPEHGGAERLRAEKKRRARTEARRHTPDVTRGDSTRMELSITFDGGYNAIEATEILDALKSRGVKTTIFLTGLFIRRHPEITRRIVADGHEVGNHTTSHPHLTEYARSYTQKTLPGVTRAFLAGELREAAEAFREVTGSEMAPLWRAPYGEINGTLRDWALQEGYLHVGWTYERETGESLDTLDWVHDTASRFYLSPDEIKEKIVNFGSGPGGLKGGIVLMHLGTQRDTDRAATVLEEMLDEIMDKGYRFVKVSRLIRGNEAYEVARGKRAGAVDLGSTTGQRPGGPS